jgi:Fe-S-cluster containining protein
VKALEVPAYLLTIKRFECQHCADCCKNLRVDVTYSDITRWKREGRWDILQRVALAEGHDGRMDFCLYETTASKSQCPFLFEDNRCRIHPTKPQVCRHFPFNATLERATLCRGVGKGPPVPPTVFQTIARNERRDFLRLQGHTSNVMKLLLGARVAARHPDGALAKATVG